MLVRTENINTSPCGNLFRGFNWKACVTFRQQLTDHEGLSCTRFHGSSTVQVSFIKKGGSNSVEAGNSKWWIRKKGLYCDVFISLLW